MINERALELHKKYRGKIEMCSKVPLETKDDLSAAYTPGVGAVCLAIKDDPEKVWELTNRGNMVAVVSDGTAILGLGNIGPEAGLPVMEGKAAIFKEFADVDALPLCISASDVEEIVKFCKNIEPSFGGINLEDISAPRCFEVVSRLQAELNIPVFHDDQDGTAIVVLAGLINASLVARKDLKKAKVVVNGAGAAGIAITKLLLAYGVGDVILVDSLGAIYEGRGNMNDYKKEIAVKTNKEKLPGYLEDIVPGRDIFVGVSKAKLVTSQMIKSMNPDPIIFALANPEPEILPPDALAAGASVVGTGRSDYPNQINNALVFPGIFRGLLDSKKSAITIGMKLAAAKALSQVIEKPEKDNILPKVTDKRAVEVIAKAVKESEN